MVEVEGCIEIKRPLGVSHYLLKNQGESNNQVESSR